MIGPGPYYLTSSFNLRYRLAMGMNYTCECMLAQVFQIVKSTAEIDFALDTNSDWVADDAGWYPNSRWVPNPKRASRNTAAMDDSPGLYGRIHGGYFMPGRVKHLRQELESCVVCRDGAQRGYVYGCITWGHDFDDGPTGTDHFSVTRWINDQDAWGMEGTGSGASEKPIGLKEQDYIPKPPSDVFKRILNGYLY